MGVREGTSLTITGSGRVVVDAAELVASARALRAAAAEVEDGDRLLRFALLDAVARAAGTPEAALLRDAIDDLRRGVHGTVAVGRGLRDLAEGTVDAAEAYGLAETDAEARWRGFVGALGRAAGATPAGGVGLAAAAVGVATGDLVVGAARDAVTRPWELLPPAGVTRWWGSLAGLPQRLTTDGRAGPVLQLLAAALGSAVGGAGPGLDPVRRFAARVAGVLPGRDVRLVPRADPPRLAAPRDLEGLVGLAAATYDAATTTGEPGTPVATVTVQRLDHGDGSRSWVVAVPGTRAMGLTGAVPTDNGTNLALAGGVPDVMTRAVLDAMAAAGVGERDPVALVGHSQGGMVATAVAATGAYAVRLVVTAGSPDVPSGPPPGAATVTLRHREDAVSLLDGKVGERGGPGTLSVVRDLAGTGGPAVPTLTQAHAVEGYVRTAAMVDRSMGDLPPGDPVRRALTDVLGSGRPEVTTQQYTATAAPDEVAGGAGVSPASSPPTGRS